LPITNNTKSVPLKSVKIAQKHRDRQTWPARSIYVTYKRSCTDLSICMMPELSNKDYLPAHGYKKWLNLTNAQLRNVGSYECSACHKTQVQMQTTETIVM